MMMFQMLMHFRSWIPGLAEARFGKLKYDSTLETYEVGRFSVGMGEIWGNGMKKNMTETLKLLTDVVSMGLYKKEINQDAVDRQFKEFKELNRDSDLTKEQFIELKKSKLRAFVSELRVYLAFTVLVQLLGGIDWDEEEAEGSLFTWNAYQLAQRALLETSFWFSPRSVDDIVRRPLPLWGVLTELNRVVDNSLVEAAYMYRGKRDLRDRTPPGYYILKNTPAVNQILDIFGFFDEYNKSASTTERIIKITQGEND
jgi:hypothetical protein